jgi:hypothetical protein
LFTADVPYGSPLSLRLRGGRLGRDAQKSGSYDRFIIAREDADPNVLWNMEVFRSHEAKDAYENGPLADELRDEIIGLLAEPPMRVEVHPYSTLPADPALASRCGTWALGLHSFGGQGEELVAEPGLGAHLDDVRGLVLHDRLGGPRWSWPTRPGPWPVEPSQWAQPSWPGSMARAWARCATRSA